MNKAFMLIGLITTSALANSIDDRQVLTLTEMQRNHVLTEMRAMLSGTQNILAALSADKMEVAAEQARLLGLDMKHKVENHMMGVLPNEFMQLGMGVHRDFDVIAADARSLKDSKHTLRQLSEAMSKCVACHDSYQIQTVNATQTIAPASEARLDEVAQRGKHVMPFDLDQTTHVFSKTEQGGVQQVIAKDKADTEQITLIRKHLSEIAVAFEQGDFSGPHQVHGPTMPGLAALKSARKDQIKIAYSELPDGSQIIYASKHPHLVEAIHQWFDAQLSDHARHAVSGHENHQRHSQ